MWWQALQKQYPLLLSSILWLLLLLFYYYYYYFYASQTGNKGQKFGMVEPIKGLMG